MYIFLTIIALIILYIILTGKKRRRRALMGPIMELAESGCQTVSLPHIAFEAALKFALEHGASLEPGQSPLYATSVGFPMKIRAVDYYVYLSRLPGGGTLIGLTNLAAIRHDPDEDFEDDEYDEFIDDAGKAPGDACANAGAAGQQARSEPAALPDSEELTAMLREFYALLKDGDAGATAAQAVAKIPVPLSELHKLKAITRLNTRLASLNQMSVEELYTSGRLHELLNRYVPEYAALGICRPAANATLIEVVKKQNNLPEGIFASIKRDLDESFLTICDPEPLLVLAYTYACQAAAAGLCLQALYDQQLFGAFTEGARAIRQKTGRPDLGEAARKQAIELLQSYDARLNAELVEFMLSMAGYKNAFRPKEGYIDAELVLHGLAQALAKPS